MCDFVKPSTQGTKWGLGGTCVNVGCIPKKLMHFSSLVGDVREDAQECGWDVDPEKKHDWKRMLKNISAHIKGINFAYRKTMIKKEIKYCNALASFVDAHTIKLVDAKNKESTITGQTIVVAVGGRPTLLDLPGYREHSITSDDLFWMKTPPGKTFVVGSGYIAMECGGFIQSMGHETHIAVRSMPLRNFDQDMAKRCTKSMELIGTKFVTQFESDKGSVEKLESGKLKVTYYKNGGEEVVEEFDSVLIAIGRTADTKGLNLEAAGVTALKNGKVPVNDINQTNVSHIYAIGDIIENSPELTPVAIAEGQYLVRRLYEGASIKVNYDMIATTIFTPLEYSCVGLSEEKATERHGADNVEVFHTAFKPLEWNFLPSRQASLCYVKVVCKIDENNKVLGIHYVGPNAGEVMQGYAVAMLKGINIEDLQNTIGIHPTCAEELCDLTITKREQPEVVKTSC